MKITATLILSLVTLILIAIGETAQSADAVILGRVCDRPIAVSVSESRTAIAVADQFTRRIVVIDFDGRTLWSAGCADATIHPSALYFSSEESVRFLDKTHGTMHEVSKRFPSGCDSIPVLSDATRPMPHIDQLTVLADGSLLVLNRASDKLSILNPSQDTLISFPARTKNRVSHVAVSQTQRVIVATRSHNPIQVFSQSGDFVATAGWNNAPSLQDWKPGPVAADIRERIIATDMTNHQLRIFDMAGNEAGQWAFPVGFDEPIGIACGIDGSIIVIFDDGTLVRYNEVRD